MSRTSFAFAVLLLTSGCAQSPSGPALDHGWAPAGACTFFGNRADRHYCATTGVQLLANPGLYNGHLVRVSGYVVAGREMPGALLYLSRESREASEAYTAVSLSGAELESIRAFAARTDALDQPVLIQVQGRFTLHLARTRAESRLPGHAMSTLSEIETWEP